MAIGILEIWNAMAEFVFLCFSIETLAINFYLKKKKKKKRVKYLGLDAAKKSRYIKQISK